MTYTCVIISLQSLIPFIYFLTKMHHFQCMQRLLYFLMQVDSVHQGLFLHQTQLKKMTQLKVRRIDERFKSAGVCLLCH